MRRILTGNSVERMHTEIEEGSVQMVTTSPPYLSLRDYAGEQQLVWGGDPACQHDWQPIGRGKQVWKGKARWQHGQIAGDERIKEWVKGRGQLCASCSAWRGAFGQEPLLDCFGWFTGDPCGACYICHSLDFLRAIHRVLRADGTVWWNLADCYNGSGGSGGDYSPGGIRAGQPRVGPTSLPGLKPKDLCLVPDHFRLAAQAAGWYMRSVIVWEKEDAMPESADDRPSRQYEPVMLMSKERQYHYDKWALWLPTRSAGDQRWRRADSRRGTGMNAPAAITGVRRPYRDVWHIDTEPWRGGGHFAPYPRELARRCILLGTSPQACASCGTPWPRIMDLRPAVLETIGWRPGCDCHGQPLETPIPCSDCEGRGSIGEGKERRLCGKCEGGRTLGQWRYPPDCLEQWPKRPCIVLDPFAGTGTTLRVAEDEGRWWIGIDISEEYLPLMEDRTAQRFLMEQVHVGHD